MKRTFIAALFAVATFVVAQSSVLSQAFTENFDDITQLSGNGWTTINNSTTVGAIANWFQGSPVSASGPFDAYNGATNAYIAANYNFTTGNSTIDGWLITPNRVFRNGDILTFYTCKASPDNYPDRLEVRLSTNGSSANVGTTGSTGDFTTLLLSVNPSLVTGVYPVAWTQYTITISGLPAPTSGRIGFRYFVTSGGPSGSNSDYIGIDNVVYTPYVCPTFTMTAAGALSGGTAGSAYSTTLTQTGALGTPSFAITAGALPPGLTLSSSGTISGTPTATGTFNFTATVSDASGCSGSSSYSITVVCAANPITFSTPPSLCANNPAYTLIEASPAGGTYSGTGVTAGAFDPAAGSQTIAYDYVDPYGCSYSSTYSITVNTPPTVSIPAITPACDNGQPFTLPAGSPSGGTYSGTGVTGSDFDPSVGTQTINYTYTDGNGCTETANATVTVNTPTAASIDPVSALCDNSSAITLTATPPGGVFSGTSVSGNVFDPAMGTQTVSYVYTDPNGCNDTTTATILVNAAPSVTLGAFSDVCSNAGPVTLNGGLPSGGVYSGTGVSAGNFDPSSGTQTVIYSYTDANGCSGTAVQQITVNTAPTVSYTEVNDTLCSNASVVTLAGGSPAGGTYSGTGVSSGMFSPSVSGMGNFSITYDYTDANGCSGSAIDMIAVVSCLSLEELTASVTVYPNPSTGSFTLATNETIAFSVTDFSGKLILSGNALEGTESIIDLSNYQAGVYFLNAEGKSIRKLIRL